jgi:hypothetical protein
MNLYNNYMNITLLWMQTSTSDDSTDKHHGIRLMIRLSHIKKFLHLDEDVDFILAAEFFLS